MPAHRLARSRHGKQHGGVGDGRIIRRVGEVCIERERESKGRASSIDAAEPFANCWSLDEGEGVKRKTTGEKGMPQGQDTGRESPYYATKDRFPLGCSCDREGVGDSGRYVKLLVLLHALLKYQWST